MWALAIIVSYLAFSVCCPIAGWAAAILAGCQLIVILIKQSMIVGAAVTMKEESKP